ncbi:hypothetical protein Y032_0013g2194 [Ancylostoma ceylanicum]|uniref:Uncharacterized protein n=1 Tax=Ancylostoma ceylanicum TaxID=53326 RepID=A0A016VCF1_9BILA|nr:hypothetical protein Y032_0013g2194 [Ancylostoma ceylanicum]
MATPQVGGQSSRGMNTTGRQPARPSQLAGRPQVRASAQNKLNKKRGFIRYTNQSTERFQTTRAVTCVPA